MRNRAGKGAEKGCLPRGGRAWRQEQEAWWRTADSKGRTDGEAAGEAGTREGSQDGREAEREERAKKSDQQESPTLDKSQGK